LDTVSPFAWQHFVLIFKKRFGYSYLKFLGGFIQGQVSHLNTSGISCRAGLGYMADGFAFFAVGVGESVIELKVHLKAGGDGEEVSSLQFPVSSGAAECEFRLGQAGFLKRFAEGFG
jgi:hypothetical protein